jgi:hypothetical protein
MHALDSTWVRLTAYWGAIAPSRPPAAHAADPGYSGYDFSALDAAVRAASAAHESVLLTISWAPSWAVGRGAPRGTYAHTWRPDAGALRQFSRAIAGRYSGRFADPGDSRLRLPRVAYFQAWNEPNLPNELSPQWTRTPHGYAAASPGIYRSLLNAVWDGVKGAQPSAQVLAGGLAPYGDRPGRQRMAPVTFLEGLLCLQGARLTRVRCGTTAHFDALDHHPYALNPTIHAFNPADVSVPDLWKLSRILRAAVAHGTVIPRRSKAIWTTELDWASNPPDHLAVSLTTQARYVSLAFYKLWRQGVTHVFWYEARDPGFAAQGLTGGGLFFSSGSAKPSAAAFRFPFVAVSSGSARTELWGRAPRPGRVTIEERRGGRWVRLTTVSTTRGGVFDTTRPRVATGVHLRARSGSVVSSEY